MTDPVPSTVLTPSDLLRWRAERQGATLFLTFGDVDWSWSAIDARVDRLAAGLAEAGVAAGDTVAIMLGNSDDYVVLWLALNRLGATEVPINPEHRGYLLTHIIAQARCRVIVAEAAAMPAIAAIRADTRLETAIVRGGEPEGDVSGFERVLMFETLATCERDLDTRGSGDLLSILFTSGTTGPSKGVMISSAFALTMAGAIIDVAGYTAADVLYNALPMFHGNAKLLSLLPAMLAGARVVLAERFSASAFWDDVRRHGCTEFNYIGGILSILLKAPPGPGDRDHAIRVMVGAGASAAIQDAFEDRFGVRLIECYGATEIGAPIVSVAGQRRAGSCGKPTDGYDVRLAGPGGREVACGEIGELWVRPRRIDSMFRGYFGMPEATVSAWQDLWFHTGDNMRRDEDGFYFFVDRAKDSIRRLGENISSFEIEQIALGHAGVLEAAAVPVPSPLGEDEVLLCVVPRPGAPFDVADLHAFCAGAMASYMRPRYYRVLEALPKTPTERVQKFVLREQGLAEGTIDLGMRSAAR